MAKFHIEAQQEWPDFEHQETTYSLQHLKAHKVTFKGEKRDLDFVVTYGLHCFAKDEEGIDSAALEYFDGRESRPFSFERYELSKQLPDLISELDKKQITEIGGGGEKYRIVEILNPETKEVSEYKIGFCCFRENRLLRLHVTTAFIEKREKPGVGKHATTSIFRIGNQLMASKRNAFGIPKEAKNKRQKV